MVSIRLPGRNSFCSHRYNFGQTHLFHKTNKIHLKYLIFHWTIIFFNISKCWGGLSGANENESFCLKALQLHAQPAAESMMKYDITSVWLMTLYNYMLEYTSTYIEYIIVLQVIMKVFAPRLCRASCWIFDGEARFKTFSTLSQNFFVVICAKC